MELFLDAWDGRGPLGLRPDVASFILKTSRSLSSESSSLGHWRHWRRATRGGWGCEERPVDLGYLEGPFGGRHFCENDQIKKIFRRCDFLLFVFFVARCRRSPWPPRGP